MQIERDVADMKAIAAVPKMIAELKECMTEKQNFSKHCSIETDLGEGIKQGSIPITSSEGLSVTKIRNFANDASQ